MKGKSLRVPADIKGSSLKGKKEPVIHCLEGIGKQRAKVILQHIGRGGDQLFWKRVFRVYTKKIISYNRMQYLFLVCRK